MGVFLETQAIILLVAPIMAADCGRFWYGPAFARHYHGGEYFGRHDYATQAVNLFVASSLVKQYNVTIERISKYVLRFLLIEIIDILIVSNFPAVSLGC